MAVLDLQCRNGQAAQDIHSATREEFVYVPILFIRKNSKVVGGYRFTRNIGWVLGYMEVLLEV
jgi:hypothetical protein